MKRFLFIDPILIIILIFLGFFQNSCSSPSSKSISKDEEMIKDSNSNTGIDEQNKKRSAVLGYSFFKNMREHETRDINAYVTIINKISLVIDTLKEINGSDIPERSNDTATILSKNIILFKALDIELANGGDSNFIIKPFAESRQVIDASDGNSWTWAITPRTNKKYGALIMNVIAEKPDGSREPFSTIKIPITISIDSDIGRSLWQWMMDNPEKVITIILIPFIVFFWKQISSLFKKKANNQS